MLKRLVTILFMLMVSPIVLPSVVEACSVHDHTCQFHGMGRAFNPNINPNSPTAVYVVTEGTTPTDFDNNVLLPDNLGPYVVSTTGYPTRSDQPYISPEEQPRHVYPTQYQIDFNGNNAQATHSGDLNGLENVPNATGCQLSSASYCEEVKVTGYIPDTYKDDGIGFYLRQTNHLYNAQNVADPSNELQSYAVATGNAFIRTFSHSVVNEGRSSGGYNYDSLTTTGEKGQENYYYFGFYDFEPHAIGVGQPVYFNDRWSTYGSAYQTQNQHQIYRWQDRTDHYQQRFITGEGDVFTGEEATNTTSILLSQTTIQPVKTQAEIQYERDQAAGCLYSGCSSDLEGVWPGAYPNALSSETTYYYTQQPTFDGSQNPNTMKVDDTILGGIQYIRDELDRQGAVIANQAVNSTGFNKFSAHVNLAFNSVGVAATDLFLLDPATGISNCLDLHCNVSDAAEVVGVIPVAKLGGYAGNYAARYSDDAFAAFGKLTNSIQDVTIRSPIPNGYPGAIWRGYADLNNRQQGLLNQLANSGDSIIIPKNEIRQKDLAALTAKTGDEFAVFTTGGRRMVIRGGSSNFSGIIDEKWASEKAAQGWRFSAHTHPIPENSNPAMILIPSDGDRAILELFPNKNSAILGSNGSRQIFDNLGNW